MARDGRRHAAHPRRRDRGRGARGRQGDGRHRALRCAGTASRGGALRAALRRRDHGHGPRQRAAAGATSSSCWRWRSRSTAGPASGAIAGDTDGVDGAEEVAGAHRRRPTRWRAPAPPASTRHGPAGRQRRARLLRGARRPGRHRPDADQRQRLPRRAGAAGSLGGRGRTARLRRRCAWLCSGRALEGWPSGLRRTPGKRVGGNSSRVQIPLPPPSELPEIAPAVLAAGSQNFTWQHARIRRAGSLLRKPDGPAALPTR